MCNTTDKSNPKNLFDVKPTAKKKRSDIVAENI